MKLDRLDISVFITEMHFFIIIQKEDKSLIVNCNNYK